MMSSKKIFAVLVALLILSSGQTFAGKHKNRNRTNTTATPRPPSTGAELPLSARAASTPANRNVLSSIGADSPTPIPGATSPDVVTPPNLAQSNAVATTKTAQAQQAEIKSSVHTLEDAPKDSVEDSKAEKKECKIALRNITQDPHALLQEDDVTLYNGASNLCGWYAVWHTYQQLNNQALTSREAFEQFCFKKSKQAFDVTKENLSLKEVQGLIDAHSIPNTRAIAVGSHGEIYEGKAAFEELDLQSPMGIIALTTAGHWVSIRADIDPRKNPMVAISFADSYNKNVMEAKDASASATRATVQAVYDHLLTRATELKRAIDAKSSAPGSATPLLTEDISAPVTPLLSRLDLAASPTHQPAIESPATQSATPPLTSPLPVHGAKNPANTSLMLHTSSTGSLSSGLLSSATSAFRPSAAVIPHAQSTSALSSQEAQRSQSTSPKPTPQDKKNAGMWFAFAQEHESSGDKKAAFELYLRAAQAGHADAQLKTANCYYCGEGTPVNAALALQWYRCAAVSGKNNHVWYTLAHLYEHGDPSKNIAPMTDKETILKCYKRGAMPIAIDSNLVDNAMDGRIYIYYADAHERLAIYYNSPKDPLRDPKDTQVDAKLAQQHYTSTMSYLKAVTTSDTTSADAKACAAIKLGFFYENGFGVEQNIGVCVSYYQLAARLNDSLACIILGNLFMYGKCDKTGRALCLQADYKEAFNWYSKAKSLRNPDAPAKLYALGDMLYHTCFASTATERAEDINNRIAMIEIALECLKASAENNSMALGMMADLNRQLSTLTHKNHARESFELTQRAVAANEKDSVAWHNLGCKFFNGDGTQTDIKEALVCFRRSAALNNAGALIVLGNACKDGYDENGDKKDPNPKAALEYYKKALACHDPNAIQSISSLGEAFEGGTATIQQDTATAFICFTICAEQTPPHARSCCNLGYHYLYGIDCPLNPEKAVALLKQATELDSNIGQPWYLLGICYENGLGLSRDIKEALACYHKAAEHKMAVAYKELGRIFLDQKNYAEAYIHLLVAVKAQLDGAQDLLGETEQILIPLLEKESSENTDAITLVGDIYNNSLSIHYDQKRAVQCYTLAAQQGSARAQYILAQRYTDGTNGITANPTTAFEWALKAAEQGVDDAMYMVAHAYETGTGVEKNLALAEQWYRNIKMLPPTDQTAIQRIAETIKREALDREKQAQQDAYLRQTEALEKEALQKAIALRTAETALEKLLQTTQCVSHTITPTLATNYETLAYEALARAQWRRAMWYPSGSKEQQYFYDCAIEHKNPVARIYQVASNTNGCSHAWYNLGRCHQLGLGGAINLNEAQQCYRRVIDAAIPDITAIEQGIAKCYKEAKTIYDIGVEELSNHNTAAAITNFNRAASLGYIPSWYQLCKCYEATNFNKAASYCLIAAQYGDANAQYTLGTWYTMEGKIERRCNKNMAFAWYELAVANGSQKALVPLAECYANGLGTKKDMEKAIIYYTQAAYQFHPRAILALLNHYSETKNAEQIRFWREFMQDSIDIDIEDNNDEEENDTEAVQPPTTTEAKQAAAIQVVYEDKAASERQISQFDSKVQKQLQTTIKQFTKDPLNKENALDIKKLKDERNVFRIRSGKQRVIFKLENGRYVITRIERRSDTTYKKS